MCERIVAEGKRHPSLQICHINIADIIKGEKLHDGYNKKFDTYMVNDKKILRYLERTFELDKKMKFPNRLNLVDFHSPGLLPAEWVDLVFVLELELPTLCARLQTRGYSERKVRENMECETTRFTFFESIDCFDRSIITSLDSNCSEELQRNAEFILKEAAESTR